MLKKKIDSNVSLYPMPVVLAGAVAGGKANFLAIGWITRVNHQPPMVAMSLSKRHHTNGGIREHKEFSVNLPGVNLLEKTDYCGLVSGREKDKSQLFTLFYGELKHAPMIEECPLVFAPPIATPERLPHRARTLRTGSSPRYSRSRPCASGSPAAR